MLDNIAYRPIPLQPEHSTPPFATSSAQPSPEPLPLDIAFHHVHISLQDRMLAFFETQASITTSDPQIALFKKQLEEQAARDLELRTLIHEIRFIKEHPAQPEQLKGVWQQIELERLNSLRHHRIATAIFYLSALNHCEEALAKTPIPSFSSENTLASFPLLSGETLSAGKQTNRHWDNSARPEFLPTGAGIANAEQPLNQAEMASKDSSPINTPEPSPLLPEKASSTRKQKQRRWGAPAKLKFLAAAAAAMANAKKSLTLAETTSRDTSPLTQAEIARQASSEFNGVKNTSMLPRLKRIAGILEDNYKNSIVNHQFSYLRDHKDRRKALVAVIKQYIAEKLSLEAIVNNLQLMNLETESDNPTPTKITFNTATALYCLAIGLATKENSRLVVQYSINSNNPTQKAWEYRKSLSGSAKSQFSRKDENKLELFAKYAEAFQTEKTTPTVFAAKFSQDESQSKEIRAIATYNSIEYLLGIIVKNHPEIDYLRKHDTERNTLLAEMKALINQFDVRTVLRNFNGIIGGHPVELITRTALYSLAAQMIPAEYSKLVSEHIRKKREKPGQILPIQKKAKEQSNLGLSP